MLLEELIAAAPRAGALQGSISFKAPQRTFSSSPAVLNNHNPGLSRPDFLSRFKYHLVTNKIHTWNSVSDLRPVCSTVLGPLVLEYDEARGLWKPWFLIYSGWSFVK